MGNLIKDTVKLYTIDWTPSNNADQFITFHNEDDISNPINGKILIPISKIFSKRDLVLKYHHNTILIEDVSNYELLTKIQFRGIPVISQEDLNTNPQLCRHLHYNEQFCPIPLILQRFHESYVKNYVNSFHFYGINILPYNKIEEYLKSSCSNRFMICSNYELQQLSFKLKNKLNSKISNKLTILCFCNKDQYRVSKRIQLFLQREGIELFCFQNLLDIIQKINCQYLVMPKELEPRLQKLFFYLSDKEKEVEYLSKMVKKLQKSIRNIVVEKVNSKQIQISKIQNLHYSILIVSSDTKEMRSNFQLYEALQKEGLEDRIIFIRRQNEINEKLTHKIYNIVQKFKYKKSNIFEKKLIFYGSLDSFKYILKHFPSLKFKKFVDVNRQRDKIKDFLQISTQVVVTNLRVCTCQKSYSSKSIQCKIIYIRSKDFTIKGPDKRQSYICEKQHWFMHEEQLLRYYNNHQNELFSVNFNYFNKKNSYISKILDEFFVKMEQKKTILYNRLNNSIFLFSSEYYTLDQMSSYIMRYFTNKILGNYQHQCLFQQLKSLLYQQLIFLCENNRIQEAVLQLLLEDKSSDVYELSQNIMQIMALSPQFLQEVNSIWALFLYQDRKQHNTNCQTLLFLLVLSFNRTNFVKYKNETIQNITLMIKRNSTVYDMDNLTTFRNKNRNNFVYNLEFLACQIYQEGQPTDSNDIFIKIQGNQLTSFHLYMPLWKKGKTAFICPFSKFQINTKTERNSLLKLSINSQHKLLQKFMEAFLEENPNQLRLFEQERQMRKFDVFLDNMAHSKFQTAGYILKKITKEQKMQNQDCLNAFHVLYHLKRNQMQLAKQKLKEDKYNEILSRVFKALKGGEESSPDEKYLIPLSFASNQRIQQNNKQYQNLESNSNQNQSFNFSAMVQTDPQMIKQLTSDNKLNLKFSSNRSPSFKMKDKYNNKFNKIPIYNKRGKQQLSICDKLSQSSKKSQTQKQQAMSIIILPPIKPIKNLSGDNKQGFQNCFNSNTFGLKFFPQYSSIGSQKQKVTQDYNQLLLRIKSTKSDTGKSEQQIQRYTPPKLQRTSSKFKQSQFAKEIVKPLLMDEEIQDSKDELLQSNQIQQTGNFHFEYPDNEKKQQSNSEILQQDENQQQIIQVDQQSQNQSEKLQQTSNKKALNFNKNDLKNKLFPIKRKQLFKLPRKSLTEVHQNVRYFQSPLRNIQQQRVSQLQLSMSTSNPILSQSQKENNQNERNKSNKLFTFFKINESLKPRFSISSNRNSLIFSNISELQKIDEKKQPLFYNFQEEKQKQDISDLGSISSLEIEQAQQIYPQQLFLKQ